MTSNSPHYLLFSEASRDRSSLSTWRFVLQNVESQSRFAATDSEPCDCGERLELLAVVRGLEALDGPARVTLVTRSRYVSRGIKRGLAQWRENNWRWERFGRIVPVRDHDLWQRVDRALQFHSITCQSWHFETVEVESSTINEESPVLPRHTRHRIDLPHSVPHAAPGPRIVHPVSRLKRRAKNQVAHLTNVFRSATRPRCELAGAAT